MKKVGKCKEIWEIRKNQGYRFLVGSREYGVGRGLKKAGIGGKSVNLGNGGFQVKSEK